MWLLLVVLCALGIPVRAGAEEPLDLAEDSDPYYFYQGLGYGSDSLVHPLRLIVNGGYGIMQLDNRSNKVWEVDYRTGAENVWRNITHPLWSIEQRGWGDFFQREVLPFSFNRSSAQYWPNYTQHLIGGGMSYRLMAEWFRYHGWPRPKLFAGTTIAVYHFLNEVVENDYRIGPTTDPVADLLLFDPASVLLFSSDRVCRFFSQRLHMAEWAYQPAYDPTEETLSNNGQNFAMKLKIKWWDRWYLFYHYGTHAEMGLSHRWDDGRCLSVGLGMKAGDLIELDRSVSTVDLGFSAGIFYDRDNSLLASLLVASTKDYKVRLNVYPGLIPLGGASLGSFLVLDRDDELVTGLTLGFLSHLPVGMAGRF